MCHQNKCIHLSCHDQDNVLQCCLILHTASNDDSKSMMILHARRQSRIIACQCLTQVCFRTSSTPDPATTSRMLCHASATALLQSQLETIAPCTSSLPSTAGRSLWMAYELVVSRRRTLAHAAILHQHADKLPLSSTASLPVAVATSEGWKPWSARHLNWQDEIKLTSLAYGRET